VADIAELGYKVDSSDLDKGTKALDRNTAAAKRTGSATEKLERDYVKMIKSANLFGIAVGAAVVGFLGLIVKNTIEAEKVQAQLAAALKSTGAEAWITQGQINAMATALQRATTYGDEEIISAQALLLTFKNIGGETFPRATAAILDMATAMGMDLKSATIQVGKALNDPILGVTALGRAGVQFSEDQKAMIKSLVETGRVAEAQRIVLGELESQFGGSAAAARDTLGGALKSLTNAFGDLLEGDTGGDGVRGTTKAINDLTDFMQSDSAKAGFQTIIQGLAGVTKFAAETIVMVAGVGETINQMMTDASNKSFDGLIQEQMRLEDDLKSLQEGFAPGLRARFDGRGISLGLDREENIEKVKKELAEIIALQDQMVRQRNEAASGNAGGAPAAPGPDTLSQRTQELIDKLKEEAAAYGLSKSALLEREKAQALAAAGNDLERETLGASYDALIAKVAADERATAASKGAGAAARERARTERELAQAIADHKQITEDLRAELAGPVAQVMLDYQRREEELVRLADLVGLTDQERAESLGLLTQARERDLAAAALQMKLEAEMLGPREQLLADLDREIALLQMGHVEREADLALEQMLYDLKRKGIELTPAQIAADRERIQSKLEEIDAIKQQIAAMDEFRSSFADNVADVLTGSKSAKEALMDMVNDFLAQLARLTAQRWSDQLFGQMGTASTGSAGGFLSSLFGSFFGGGRAFGGDVRGDRMYQVGERDRPELANIGGKQYMIPGDRGRVTPMGDADAAPNVTNVNNIQFVLPGRNDLRTEPQRQADLARSTNRQLARGTA
jgi:hypothetical protein